MWTEPLPTPVFLQAAATAVPETRLLTEELITAHRPLLSDDLVATIRSMGVDSRHVVVRNAPAFLTGQDDAMQMDGNATTLAVAALRNTLDALRSPGTLGLLIAVTNTQVRPLPGLAAEVLAATPDILPRTLRHVNMQGMGCAGLQKAIETAQWFLAAHPDQQVAIVASEANSPIAPRLSQGPHLSFREIGSGAAGDSWMAELARTGAMMQNFLFGDGASCLVLSTAPGPVEFGPMRHLTNVAPEDQDLVRIDAGSVASVADGRARFTMEPSLLAVGPGYVVDVVRALVADALPEGDPTTLAPLLMHTGSRKLLDIVARELGVPRESPALASAYGTLRRYANLSSASTGFMFAEGDFAPGIGLMAGFGGGFSATAGLFRVH